MALYKIETHMHTILSSKCGWLNAEEALTAYKAKGYSGIAVTDHFNRATVKYLGIDLSDRKGSVEKFFLGYTAMAELAPSFGMKVYYASEVRFDGSENDFLVYGATPELFYDPDSVMKGGLEAFYRKAHDAGALVVQAHPNRAKCYQENPEWLDGVEVFNMHLRHQAHNSVTLEFAKAHEKLIMTAGSDCHRPQNVGTAGLLMDFLPENTFELAAAMREERYELFMIPERVEDRP